MDNQQFEECKKYLIKRAKQYLHSGYYLNGDYEFIEDKAARYIFTDEIGNLFQSIYIFPGSAGKGIYPEIAKSCNLPVLTTHDCKIENYLNKKNIPFKSIQGIIYSYEYQFFEQKNPDSNLLNECLYYLYKLFCPKYVLKSFCVYQDKNYDSNQLDKFVKKFLNNDLIYSIYQTSFKLALSMFYLRNINKLNFDNDNEKDNFYNKNENVIKEYNISKYYLKQLNKPLCFLDKLEKIKLSEIKK